MARRSHKRILDLLKAGAECSTVDVGRPTIHDGKGNALLQPRRRTLDEMVELGFIHRFYAYVGDGTRVDDHWHLGSGGDVADVLCGKCECRYCPICHPCFGGRRD